MIYSNYRLESLAEILSENLLKDLSDPFQSPCIVCSSKTMEQYINKTMADNKIISANNEVLFPRNAINKILQDLTENKDITRLDKGLMQWKVFALLPELVDNEDYKVIKEYIDKSPLSFNFSCYQLSKQIAAVFDTYIGYRSNWLSAWSKGELIGNLGEHEKWQADLWRRLLDGKGNYIAPTEVFIKDKLESIKDTLPARMSIFGLSSLPPDYIQCFTALAEFIEIDFYYLMPCVEYWGDFKRQDKIEEKANPLLANSGIVGRDFLNLLIEADWDVGGVGEVELDASMTQDSLLKALQYDILTAKNTNKADDYGFSSCIFDLVKEKDLSEDESIVINNCHTKMREIEVLYDFICKQISTGDYDFDDILVMAPDIEEYAPYIQAVFGQTFDSKESRFIPFSLTDCSTIFRSQEADVFLKILKLANSKFSALDVFEIISSEPLKLKFHLSGDDLKTIRKLLLDAYIAWGKDKEHRKKILEIDYTEQNTWLFGFKRLLAGYAYDREDLINDGTLPFTIEGNKAILAGKLISIVEKLFALSKILNKDYDSNEWFSSNVLYKVFSDFIEVPDNKNEGAILIREALEGLEKDILAAEYDSPLSLDIIIDAIESLFKSQFSERNSFFRGNVTFCRLLPMRNIPSKIVCLLGMNDGDFPRIDSNNGLDLMKVKSCKGDRSLRNDDRYIFLETIMATRDILYFSYLGQSKENNEELPCSILLEELLDYLNTTTGKDKKFFVTKHFLHGFNQRYFTEDDLQYFSYSENYCKVAKTYLQGGNSEEARMFCPNEIPLPDEELEFSFENFVEFFLNPPKFFLKYILNISLYEEDLEPLPLSEPFALDSLENYKLKDEILKFYLKGKDKDFDIVSILKARGVLPIGQLGENILENALKSSKEIKNLISSFGKMLDDVKPVTINCEVDGVKIKLSGTFDNLYENGQFFVRNSDIKEKDKLKSWIWHCLALKAEIDFKRTICIGNKDQKVYGILYKLDDTPIDEIFDDLLKCFISGIKQPLPFFLNSSNEFIKKSGNDGTTDEYLIEASKKWYSSYSDYGFDSLDRANVICFGEDFPGLMEKYKEKFLDSSEKIYAPLLERENNSKSATEIEQLLQEQI